MRYKLIIFFFLQIVDKNFKGVHQLQFMEKHRILVKGIIILCVLILK